MDVQRIKDEAFKEALIELREEYKTNPIILKKISEAEKNEQRNTPKLSQ